MKTNAYYFVISALMMLLVSCTPGLKKQSVEALASEISLDAIELTSKFYNQSEQSLTDFKHKADYLNILTNNSAFPKNTFGKQTESMQLQIREMQQVLSVYTTLYNAYYKITALKMSKEQAAFQTAALACVNELKKHDTKSENKEKITQLENAVGSYQISVNDIMYQLNDLFTVIIQSDLINIQNYTDEFYQQYADALKNVPVYKFDSLKVEQLIDEPYSDKQVLINLYKLRMDEESYNSTKALKNKAKNIIEVLNELNLMHAEIQTRNRSDDKIKNRILKIEQLSSN